MVGHCRMEGTPKVPAAGKILPAARPEVKRERLLKGFDQWRHRRHSASDNILVPIFHIPTCTHFMFVSIKKFILI